MALVYENDLLIRAATRGDGVAGEDITNNAKALASIPLRAAFSKYGIHKIEIRGEVIIQRSVFEKMNEERKAKGEKVFQNARNTASGSLRTKDPNESRARNLEAILYHVSFAEDADGKNLIAEKLESHLCLQNEWRALRFARDSPHCRNAKWLPPLFLPKENYRTDIR